MIHIIGTLDPSRHSQMDVLGIDGICSTVDTLKERKKIAIPIIGGGTALADIISVGNTHPSGRGMNGKVYYTEGSMATLSTNKGEGNKIAIPVKEATRSGYAIARGGQDSINLTAPESRTRRGRVGVDMANTLDTGCKQGIFVQVSEDLCVYAIWYEKYQCYIAIRRLTPKECFRLQGWTDDYFEKAEFVNSDSQLYKQAGNGITVNVVHAIAERMNDVTTDD